MFVGSEAAGPSVPPSVLAFAEGRSLRLVWENMLGGLTFEIMPR